MQSSQLINNLRMLWHMIFRSKTVFSGKRNPFSHGITLRSKSLYLVGQDHLDKLFVIDVSRRVFLTMNEIFNVFLGHSFSETGQEMSELGGGDEAVAVLVEVAEAFDEVLDGIGDLLGADGLQNGQKGLERDATIGLVVLD